MILSNEKKTWKPLGGRGGSVYLAQKNLVHCPIIRILTRCLLQSGVYLWAWTSDASTRTHELCGSWPSFNPAWNLKLRLQPSGYIRTSYRYTTVVGFETRSWCLVDVWQFALSSNDGPELLHPATISNHQPCFQATTQPPTSIRTQLFGRRSSPWRSPRFCSSSSVQALVLARVRSKPLFSLTWKCICLKKSPKRSNGLSSA